MKAEGFEAFARYYDKLYLRRKNYEDEAKILLAIIRKYETRDSKALLDVGCGTGEHLRHLSSQFQCTGVDANERMIWIATRKAAEANFVVANMIDLELNKTFDVIVSLFGAIGYTETFDNLVETLKSFDKHLSKGGLLLVEPWVFIDDFIEGHVSLDTFEDEQLKFARMATSRIERSRWLIFMHYLIGERGKIDYATEIHKMLALNLEDYIEAFEQAGFKNTQYLRKQLWDNCRGLFVATK